ncbi:hypothetical protein LCGC14_3036630, partial [marine sediment metagenome]
MRASTQDNSEVAINGTPPTQEQVELAVGGIVKSPVTIGDAVLKTIIPLAKRPMPYCQKNMLAIVGTAETLMAAPFEDEN